MDIIRIDETSAERIIPLIAGFRVTLRSYKGTEAEPDFEWAKEEASRKKKKDFSGVEFFAYDEGTCVQCMHIGPYDDEPATVSLMDEYIKQNGYVNDIDDERMHHEIYLSDPRKVAPEKRKTVIRHPVRRG